jgi:hypothetical protein
VAYGTIFDDDCWCNCAGTGYEGETCTVVPSCHSGADGTLCRNGGTATGAIPSGSSVAEACSCTCPGESSAACARGHWF